MDDYVMQLIAGVINKTIGIASKLTETTTFASLHMDELDKCFLAMCLEEDAKGSVKALTQAEVQATNSIDEFAQLLTAKTAPETADVSNNQMAGALVQQIFGADESDNDAAPEVETPVYGEGAEPPVEAASPQVVTVAVAAEHATATPACAPVPQLQVVINPPPAKPAPVQEIKLTPEAIAAGMEQAAFTDVAPDIFNAKPVNED